MRKHPMPYLYPDPKHPHDTKIGDIFRWKDRMWRRGRGIIYVAHPNLRIRRKFYPKHRQPGAISKK